MLNPQALPTVECHSVQVDPPTQKELKFPCEVPGCEARFGAKHRVKSKFSESPFPSNPSLYSHPLFFKKSLIPIGRPCKSHPLQN